MAWKDFWLHPPRSRIWMPPIQCQLIMTSSNTSSLASRACEAVTTVHGPPRRSSALHLLRGARVSSSLRPSFCDNLKKNPPGSCSLNGSANLSVRRIKLPPIPTQLFMPSMVGFFSARTLKAPRVMWRSHFRDIIMLLAPWYFYGNRLELELLRTCLGSALNKLGLYLRH